MGEPERVVHWNYKALSTLRQIIDRMGQYSPKMAAKFVELVEVRIEVLIRYPESGRKSGVDPNIRAVRIDDRRLMYYRYSDR